MLFFYQSIMVRLHRLRSFTNAYRPLTRLLSFHQQKSLNTPFGVACDYLRKLIRTATEVGFWIRKLITTASSMCLWSKSVRYTAPLSSGVASTRLAATPLCVGFSDARRRIEGVNHTLALAYFVLCCNGKQYFTIIK